MARSAAWTVKEWEACEARLIEALEAAGSTDETRLTYVLARLAQVGQQPSAGEAFLEAIACGIHALEIHGRSGGLTAPDARRIFDDTVLLLKGSGIKAGSSRLSFLYGRLYKSFSAELLRKGETLEAAAQYEVARHLTYRPSDELDRNEAMEMARLRLRLGHSSLAIEQAKAALAAEPDDDIRRQAVLVAASALRLSGAVSEAKEWIAEISNGEERDGPWEARWEHVACRLQESADPLPGCLKVLRDRRARLGETLHAKLWIYALANRAAKLNTPKAYSLRRRTNVTPAEVHKLQALLNAVQTLDKAYDNDQPLADRLRDVGKACARRRRLPYIEAELLLLAGAARHAAQYSQRDLARLYVAQYRSLSLQLSDGVSKDVLNLGLGDDATAVVSSTKDNGLAHGIKRTGKTLSLAAKAVGIAAGSRIRRSLAAEDEKRRLADNEVTAIGEALYGYMAQLKGGFMKLGQFLSMSDQVPKELRASLALLRECAEPLPPMSVEREFKRAFGDPDQVFESWDRAPLAVGSIAQIHRAKLARDGREVVVKIQHPGIREAMASDLRGISVFKPLIRQMIPGADVSAIFEELKDRFVDELDFVKEAETQMAFRRIFEDDPDVYIPEVVTDLSSDSVLVMDYVKGRPYYDFVAAATPEERNRAGVTIARFFSKAFFEYGIFNGDPHPGNYIFMEDGRVGFLDFGCNRRWSMDFVETWLQSIVATMYGDFETFSRMTRALGYDGGNPDFDMRAHWDLACSIHKPLLVEGRFRFDEIYQREVANAHMVYPNMKTAAPPPQALVLIRVPFGLSHILSELEAEADWRGMVMAWLERRVKVLPGNEGDPIASIKNAS